MATPQKIRNIVKVVPIVDEVLGRMAYDDAFPDVGMGPLPFMILDDILRENSLTKSDVDYDGILDEVIKQRRKRY